jgi:hypothetical protein
MHSGMWPMRGHMRRGSTSRADSPGCRTGVRASHRLAINAAGHATHEDVIPISDKLWLNARKCVGDLNSKFGRHIAGDLKNLKWLISRLLALIRRKGRSQIALCRLFFYVLHPICLSKPIPIRYHCADWKPASVFPKPSDRRVVNPNERRTPADELCLVPGDSNTL